MQQNIIWTNDTDQIDAIIDDWKQEAAHLATAMAENPKETMADPTSRAELVGGLVEVLIFIIPAGAYALSFRIRASLRRLRYGTDRPRVIIGHATNSY